MKNYFIVAVMMFTSILANAQTTVKASEKEKSLICKALQKNLQESEADVGIDLKSCLKNKSIRSRLLQEGVREVSGKISLSTMSVECKIAYEVEPLARNVVSPLTCN